LQALLFVLQMFVVPPPGFIRNSLSKFTLLPLASSFCAFLGGFELRYLKDGHSPREHRQLAHAVPSSIVPFREPAEQKFGRENVGEFSILRNRVVLDGHPPNRVVLKEKIESHSKCAIKQYQSLTRVVLSVSAHACAGTERTTRFPFKNDSILR